MNDSWIRRVWERSGLTGRLLRIPFFPVSCGFFLAVQMRNACYSLGLMPTRLLPVPVISVGNLTVGGTGKTPTVLWLAQELGKRDYKVAILSRGYKRTGNAPVLLEPGFQRALSPGSGSEASECGDEPLMMARIYGQRVGVGKNRFEVGTRLLEGGPVDVFILDDGYQHRRVRRDVDLLLLGSEWNGALLPAGPFREPKSALGRADLCLVTGAREKWEPMLAKRSPRGLFFGSLKPKALMMLESGVWKEYPLSLLDRSKILTVSAIARPASFYRMIHDWEGEIAHALEFPDHHDYSAGDWQRINRAARNVDFIVTTEKDILKLVRFPFAREKLLALRVEMEIEEGNSLIQRVEEAILKKRGA